MKIRDFTIASVVAVAIGLFGYALFAGPVMTATEDFVTNETAKVSKQIGVASNNVVKIAKAQDYIVKTNLQSQINHINDKAKGVKWEALMVNGQLYYVATMPADDDDSGSDE